MAFDVHTVRFANPGAEPPLLVAACRIDVPTATRFDGLLSHQEVAAADTYVQDADRRRSRLAAGLTRHLLARILRREARGLALERDASGRPRLADGGPDFNRSHAGDWVVVGVSALGRIGVDVEALRGVPEPALTARVLSPAERAWCATEPAERFPLLWTRKEAMFKRDGLGITGDLSACDALVPRPGLTTWRLDDRHRCSVCADPQLPEPVWERLDDG